MIFNSAEDIRKNVQERISNYLGEYVQQNSSIDTKNIIALLRSYFYELKIREEVIDYNICDYNNDYVIKVTFKKLNDIMNFEIDLYTELRKMKIVKIQEHEGRKNILKFSLNN